MKVLICDEHGGFGLSRAALHRLRALGSAEAIAETDVGEPWPGTDKVRDTALGDSFLRDIPRSDPLLLQVFEEMGQDAACSYCHLKAVEIPDDVSWHIDEYDGFEWVAEDYRTWR